MLQRGFSSPRRAWRVRACERVGREAVAFSQRTMSLGPALPLSCITLSARCSESTRDFSCCIPGPAITPRRGERSSGAAESRGAQTGTEPRAAPQGPRSRRRSPEEGLATCASHRDPVIGGDRSCPQDTWAFSLLIFTFFLFHFLHPTPPAFLSQKQKKTKETRFQFPKK